MLKVSFVRVSSSAAGNASGLLRILRLPGTEAVLIERRPYFYYCWSPPHNVSLPCNPFIISEDKFLFIDVLNFTFDWSSLSAIPCFSLCLKCYLLVSD